MIWLLYNYMLRNYYEIMLLPKLCELRELWKQVLKIVFETPKLVDLISLIDFEKKTFNLIN